MGHTGGAEQVPVIPVDGALVSHHQPGQHSGAARFGHPLTDAFAHPLPRGLDRVPAARTQPHRGCIARTVAHVPGGTYTVFPEPALTVKTVRVEGTVRAAQANDQAPAVACPPGRPIIRSASGMPGQLQALRQPHRLASVCGGLDHPLEAHAIGAALRQAGNATGQREVHPFEGGSQRPGGVMAGAKAGQTCARQGTGGQRQQHRRPGPASAHAGDAGGQTGQGQQRRRAPYRPQSGLLQLQGDPQHPAGQCRHGGPAHDQMTQTACDGARLASSRPTPAGRHVACTSIVVAPC